MRIEAMLKKLCMDQPTVRLEIRDLKVLSLMEDEQSREAGEDGYLFALGAITNLAKRAKQVGVEYQLWEQLCWALGDPGVWGPNLINEARRILEAELSKPSQRGSNLLHRMT